MWSWVIRGEEEGEEKKSRHHSEHCIFFLQNPDQCHSIHHLLSTRSIKLLPSNRVIRCLHSLALRILHHHLLLPTLRRLSLLLCTIMKDSNSNQLMVGFAFLVFAFSCFFS